MSSRFPELQKQAAEIEAEMWGDPIAARRRGARGGGEQVPSPPVPASGAVRTRGAVRARGVAGAAAPSGETSRSRSWTVVVEVPQGRPRPAENQIRAALGLQGELDIYYVVTDRIWAALEARELNPEDGACGAEHILFLSSLKPDYALLPAGRKDRPAWCPLATEVRPATWS
jgi:hypothetical protein